MPARRPSLFPGLLVGLLLVILPGAIHAGMIGAGASPRSVVLGDLNEDGYLDLISGNAESMVTVHLGRGNRTYDPRVSYVVGATVAGIAVADLNADDHLDVVSTCPTIDKISVRFGAGDGGLSARTDYTVGGAPRAVAVGDFNGDTVPDLALVGDGFSLVLMVGTGGGAFSGPSFFGVGTASDLALGDFDGNGALDVATASNADGVTIWRGMGAANFMPHVNYSMGGATSDITLADFDSDGDLDVAAPVASINQAVIRTGNGDGTFGPLTGYVSAIGPTAIASGDLNGDTQPDLVVSSSTSSSVFVHRNNGGGLFSVHPYHNAGLGINGIAIGNLDVLAPIDFALSVAGQNSINVVQGNGDITFVAPAGPVYVWANASGAAWDAFSWLPPRNAPSTSDVLVFNRGGTVLVSGVGTSSVRQAVFSGGTVAECEGLGTATLTITGGAGTDLAVERSSKLVLNSALGPIECNIAAGATAEINGDVEIRGGASKLQALDVNGVVFQSTGRAIIGPGSSTTPFGNGVGASGLNSVLFHYGSVYIAQTTVAVFGASAPSAVVVFWPGSRFRQDVAFTPAASGRTYADYEYNVPAGNTTITGGNPFQVDSLIVTQGTFTVAMTGTVTIRGNVVITACAGANQLVFAPPTPATYRFGGASRQFVYSTAGCYFNVLRMYASPNVTFETFNPAGVHFTQGWRTAANFHFTQGNIGNPNRWQLASDSTTTITGASQSTGWFETDLSRRVTADGIVRFDVGDSANYLPMDIDVHGVTTPGYVVAGNMAWDHSDFSGAQLDANHRVHRTWILTASNTATNTQAPTFFANLDATYPFLASDVSPGSDPLQFEARLFGGSFGNPSWRPTTPGLRTATSLQALGLAPGLVDSFVTAAVGQPITPSLSVFSAAEAEGNGPGPALQATENGPTLLASLDPSPMPAFGDAAEIASPFRTVQLESRIASVRTRPMQAQSAGSLAFRVRLSQAAVVPITVDYETLDGTATEADGDYTPISGTLNFAAGDTALDIVVPFGVDATPEFNETFGLTLSNAANATIATPTATGTILDDDDVTAPTATVLYPNGGELILQNQQVNLTWTATDDFTVTSVDLYIVRGAAQEALAIGHPNTGSYAWSASGAASNKVRFRVVAHDVNHQTIDNSNANWELSASAIGVDDAAPLAFALPAPAPNPAPAGRNRIAFAMPHAANVKLTVHDIQGRTLAKLADGPVPAGRHERTWDATRAAAGVYFIRFEAPGFHAERRLVVIR